jgi:hypothetical protein
MVVAMSPACGALSVPRRPSARVCAATTTGTCSLARSLRGVSLATPRRAQWVARYATPAAGGRTAELIAPDRKASCAPLARVVSSHTLCHASRPVHVGASL